MPIVKDSKQWKEMAGDTELEKLINAYLTQNFIERYNVPDDECLREAKEVINLVTKWTLEDTTGE